MLLNTEIAYQIRVAFLHSLATEIYNSKNISRAASFSSTEMMSIKYASSKLHEESKFHSNLTS